MNENIPVQTTAEAQPADTDVSETLGATAVESIQDDNRQDADKAWDMAHAGKDYRDDAAHQREKAKNIEIGLGEVTAAAEDLRQPGETQRAVLQEARDNYGRSDEDKVDFKKRDFEAMDRIDEVIKTCNYEVRSALYQLSHALRDSLDFDQGVEQMEGSLRQDKMRAEGRAEANDNHAERLEDWAGILHDHPLSDAYNERFGLDVVTPEILIKVEDEIPSTQPEKIARFAYGTSDEQYYEYDVVMSDPDSTSETRDKAYKAALEQYAKKMTVEMKLKKTFLEDIRTGRANMWQ